mmetsp:Transcript_11853/g.27780  ORF Transcript_11853/g.27780 Transcript_11853/m.27780 type:complete len:271 (-) Transcript_11853:172-984(-)
MSSSSRPSPSAPPWPSAWSVCEAWARSTGSASCSGGAPPDGSSPPTASGPALGPASDWGISRTRGNFSRPAKPVGVPPGTSRKALAAAAAALTSLALARNLATDAPLGDAAVSAAVDSAVTPVATPRVAATAVAAPTLPPTLGAPLAAPLAAEACLCRIRNLATALPTCLPGAELLTLAASDAARKGFEAVTSRLGERLEGGVGEDIGGAGLEAGPPLPFGSCDCTAVAGGLGVGPWELPWANAMFSLNSVSLRFQAGAGAEAGAGEATR